MDSWLEEGSPQCKAHSLVVHKQLQKMKIQAVGTIYQQHKILTSIYGILTSAVQMHRFQVALLMQGSGQWRDSVKT